ncbi:unnamed protein product [Aureobasidium uvarum]|uniref:Aminotransferase class I/classII large domain-containing protein n=1 Tax=Aureobasidium uvarum TaxID=2773716 RepID=A0A9N8KBT8_9PEZI|nr:unnamed protein product [Aureobasidium uvarum]
MLSQAIANYTSHRSTSDPLPSGPAPFTSSESFKLCRPGTKPKAKSWDHHLSTECRNRLPSNLKASASSVKPGLDGAPIIPQRQISLGAGRPIPEYFPWDSLELSGKQSRGAAVDEAVVMPCTRGEQDFDFAVALNYGYAAGSPQLLRFITEHIEMIHDPPYDDWETCLTSGTTSAMDTVFRMFCDRGDWIITEEYSYPGAIEAVTPLGINILGIKMDGQGLIPEDLEAKLRSWDPARGRKPSVMYIVPCGQNPTGATQSAERRRKIYQVAEEHDLYIIEDDPYYFLKLHSRSESGEDKQMPVDEYLRQLPPSYLSMDVSGRVVRLDATSKILAPGLRCAWMTCCSQIAEKYMNYTEVGSVAPSGFSQVAMYKLLDVTWGHEGFIRWLAFLSHQYRQRRDALAGMFLWLHLQSPTPRISCSSGSDCSIEKEKTALLDLEERIYNRSMENGVVISKGSWFAAEPDQLKGIKLRLTFATAPLDSFDWAVKQFADAVRSEL